MVEVVEGDLHDLAPGLSEGGGELCSEDGLARAVDPVDPHAGAGGPSAGGTSAATAASTAARCGVAALTGLTPGMIQRSSVTAPTMAQMTNSTASTTVMTTAGSRPPPVSTGALVAGVAGERSAPARRRSASTRGLPGWSRTVRGRLRHICSKWSACLSRQASMASSTSLPRRPVPNQAAPAAGMSPMA